MTPTINLLPWREWRRKRSNRLLFLQFAGVLLISWASIGALALHFSGDVEAQQRRNTLLQQKIAQLDRNIDEIHRLKDQRDRLITRICAIKALAAERRLIVHVLDELANRLPTDVHLEALVRKDGALTLIGASSSNQGVFELMRKLNQSDWLASSTLANMEEAKGAAAQGRAASTFNLKVTQINAGAPASINGAREAHAPETTALAGAAAASTETARHCG